MKKFILLEITQISSFLSFYFSFFKKIVIISFSLQHLQRKWKWNKKKQVPQDFVSFTDISSFSYINKKLFLLHGVII